MPILSLPVKRHVQHLFRADHTPVIAVLGAHSDRMRAAWSVPAYLRHQGARLHPINPRLTGTELFGQPVLAHLGQLPERSDCVVVFRRSDALPGHLDELLDAEPRLVWLQLGVRHSEVRRRLEERGIPVVEDRCIKVDHARYVGFSASS